MVQALQARKVKMPTYTQINNYLVYYKKKKYGSHQISLGDLEQRCENNRNIPIDENESFVVLYKILYNDEGNEDDGGNKFRIFISCLSLLKIASMS